MASIISDWEKRMQRKRMTPEFRRRLEQRRAESARNVAEIGRSSRAASSACASGTSTSRVAARGSVA
jgi:hypothetical protein